MSNNNVAIRQDLPPKGGYKPVDFMRVPAKKFLNGYVMFGGMMAMMFTGLYIYGFTHRKLRRFRVEERSARFALMPLLFAEKERAYLKQIRKNRDEEARLMANVPGWVVGTYYGEPVFKTRPEGEWFDVSINEFYAHTSNMEENHYTKIHVYH